MTSAPIGIFDSGIGGTSIMKEIHQKLPHEHIIYLADSKNAPYGNKPPKKILELSIKNTLALRQMGCKLIVVACNTATTNAISYLRCHYKLPFIGIEPAIKPAALKTKTKVIGILATKGTLSSALFHKTSDLFAHHITVVEQEGDGIVDLIESGKINSKAMRRLLIKYLTPMLTKQIDYLVLGCTHYPYLIPTLKTLLPPEVKIIDSGAAVAQQTQYVLDEKNLLNTKKTSPDIKVFTNTKPDVLNTVLNHQFSSRYLDF